MILYLVMACTTPVSTPAPMPAATPTPAPATAPATPVATPVDCWTLDEEDCDAALDCGPQVGRRCSDDETVFVGCLPVDTSCADTGLACALNGDTGMLHYLGAYCERPDGSGCPEGFTQSATSGRCAQ